LKPFSRIICIILDGVGVGEAPDADEYGDAGSNSVGNTARAVGGLHLPNLGKMGLGNICDVSGVAATVEATAHFGILTPRAPGKDSTSGHWELMGCLLDRPMPTYPNGFPADIVKAFEAAVGRGVLGNVPASGTEIIKELGEQHVATGKLIVYTSQDSVFQIAAHEEVIAVQELYRYCEIARNILTAPNDVGRVIARPFLGLPGGYYRTERRKDFSLAPPGPTVLEALTDAGKKVLTIGKIDELFAGRGITRAEHTSNNREGMHKTLEVVRADVVSHGGKDDGPRWVDGGAGNAGNGGDAADFIFANLVDFDTMWGHRNDARAYALGLEEFDSFLNQFLPALRDDDLLLITSDHGNDPTTPSTDHSRERVPLLAYYPGLVRGKNLGTRETFADVGRTVADNFRLTAAVSGRSFLAELL
jgi:phosphopentomutase